MLLITTTWSVANLIYHMIEPIGTSRLEITILILISIISVLITPLYYKEIHWGYFIGTLVNLIIIFGGIYSILTKNYFFSLSIYNLSVIVVYISATIGLYLNYRSLQLSSRSSWKKTMVAVTSTLLLTVIIAYSIQANYGAISEYRSIQIQTRINNQINKLDSIDDKIQLLVNKGDIPSMVVGIVVNDKLVYSEAFGETSIETAYSCGSVTKMITATGIMLLYESGKIDLDADISLYLPFKVQHPEFPDSTLKVRYLLTHQSGLGSLTMPEEAYYIEEQLVEWLSQKHGWSISKIDPRPSLIGYLEELLAPGGQFYSDRVWSNVEPGTEHIYSNTNYAILATIIEQVSGQKFEEFMDEHIFKPLKMNNSGFDYTKVEDDYATGFEREYTLLSKTNLKAPNYNRVPGPGGLISTVSDLSKFMFVHLSDGPIIDAKFLSDESIDLMHKKMIQGGGHINKIGYSYGFTHLSDKPWEFYGEYYGMNGAVGHEGGNIGYVGALYFVKENNNGYGIIILSNISNIENGIDYNWYFPVYYKINVLLMEEAMNWSVQSHN